MSQIAEKSLVSYVIGVRNMEKTIGKTIESILNQDYPNKEIIVINDGSDDKTEDILKRYPIKFKTTHKKGISNARNLGYKLAEGKFVAFTDADCELDPLWTKNLLEGFKDNNVGLIGGRTIFRTDETYSSIYRSLEFSRRFKNIKKEDVVWAGGPSSMFRKRVLDEIGGFNPQWIHGEDAEISFLTVEHGYKILKKDEAITYHIPESGFWRLVKKGLRDGKAYVRATGSHVKTSLHNKFNMKWYFAYDTLILPILYAFMIFSCVLLPIFFLFNSYFSIPLLKEVFFIILLHIWIWSVVLTSAFLIIYGLIPSFQVAALSKNKKIKAFLGTNLLHHARGAAWGVGLIIGIKNTIFSKN